MDVVEDLDDAEPVGVAFAEGGDEVVDGGAVPFGSGLVAAEADPEEGFGLVGGRLSRLGEGFDGLLEDEGAQFGGAVEAAEEADLAEEEVEAGAASERAGLGGFAQEAVLEEVGPALVPRAFEGLQSGFRPAQVAGEEDEEEGGRRGDGGGEGFAWAERPSTARAAHGPTYGRRREDVNGRLEAVAEGEYLGGMRILAGRLKGRRILLPRRVGFRPMQSLVRKALFDALRPWLGAETVFLDLFGGSGSVAFEAWSRGVESVLVNEIDRENWEVIRANAERFGTAPSFRMFRLDYREMLALCLREGRVLDVVFCAPPYAMEEAYGTVSGFFREHPELLRGLLVLEAHRRTELDLGGFEVVRDRTYGATRLVFLRWGDA